LGRKEEQRVLVGSAQLKSLSVPAFHSCVGVLRAVSAICGENGKDVKNEIVNIMEDRISCYIIGCPNVLSISLDLMYRG
jgi:hypothetical protein